MLLANGISNDLLMLALAQEFVESVDIEEDCQKALVAAIEHCQALHQVKIATNQTQPQDAASLKKRETEIYAALTNEPTSARRICQKLKEMNTPYPKDVVSTLLGKMVKNGKVNAFYRGEVKAYYIGELKEGVSQDALSK